MTKRKIKVVGIASVVFVLLLVGGTSAVIASTNQAKNQNKKMVDIWLEEPKYYVIEGEVDTSAFVLENENKTFTEKQKEQLYNIICNWYTEQFEQSKGLKLESFENISTSKFETELVECDGKEMILVTFKTPQMEKRIDLFKGDTIQTLIYNENNEYKIYKAWYKGAYKYTRVN